MLKGTSVSNLESDFKVIKRNIATLIEKKAKLVGKEEQKLAELLEKFNITNLDDAEKLMDKLSSDIELDEKKLLEIKDELENIVEKAECHASV